MAEFGIADRMKCDEPTSASRPCGLAVLWMWQEQRAGIADQELLVGGRARMQLASQAVSCRTSR